MGGKVIDINGFRLGKAADRVADLVEERFGFRLAAQTTPADLPDGLLANLIKGRQGATDFLQGFIIRLLGLGRGINFQYLAKDDKMAVLDAYFALLDQFRFEAMRRLGWLTIYPGLKMPVVLIGLQPELVKKGRGEMDIATDHPSYREFDKRRHLDGEVVIRQLIPEALKEFERLHGADDPTNRPSLA